MALEMYTVFYLSNILVSERKGQLDAGLSMMGLIDLEMDPRRLERWNVYLRTQSIVKDHGKAIELNKIFIDFFAGVGGFSGISMSSLFLR